MQWYLVGSLTIIMLMSGCVSQSQFSTLETQMDQNLGVVIKVINSQTEQINKMKRIERFNTAVMDCYMNQSDPSPAVKDTCIQSIIDEIKNETGGATNAKTWENDLPEQPGETVQGAAPGDIVSDDNNDE